ERRWVAHPGYALQDDRYSQTGYSQTCYSQTWAISLARASIWFLAACSLSAVDPRSGGPSVATLTRPDISPRGEENANVNDPRPSGSKWIVSILHTPLHCVGNVCSTAALRLGLRVTEFRLVAARVIPTLGCQHAKRLARSSRTRRFPTHWATAYAAKR